VQRVSEVLVALVPVADDGAGVAGEDPAESMALLVRSPVCMAVRNSVQATWT